MNQEFQVVGTKFYIGVFWGTILSMPLWALFIFILLHNIKS